MSLDRKLELDSNQATLGLIANANADSLRSILQSTIVEPGHKQAPWLADILTIERE